MAHGGATAATLDVVLTSNSITTSFQTVALAAGTWDIDLRTEIVPGSPNWIAWNAWGFASGCNSEGEDCATGWLSYYTIATSEGTTRVNELTRYASAELARAAFGSFALVLGAEEEVTFGINDGSNPATYFDNLGGLSLRLTLRDAPPPPNPDPPSVIPLPAGGLLLLSAFGLMGLASRRRRDTHGA